MVSHGLCETLQRSLGLLRPRLEAATLHPHQETRNHEPVDNHTSFSSVSPPCTRVRGQGGVPCSQPGHPLSHLPNQDKPITNLNEQEKLVRMDHVTLVLRHKTQMLPPEPSQQSHSLPEHRTYPSTEIPETSACDFVSQP